MQNQQKTPRLESLRAMLSHLSEAEKDEAEARLWRIINIAQRIQERLIRERIENDDSTNSSKDSTLKER